MNHKEPSKNITALVCGGCAGVLIACIAIVATIEVIDAKRAPVVQSSQQTFEQSGTGSFYRPMK